VVSTTTTSTTVVTSTSEVDTTTTSEGSNVVTTVEEAEAILRELWFGWFEGIYNRDEDRIREVVGSSQQVDAAVAQFGQLELTRAPMTSDFTFTDTEILHASDDCTAIWTQTTASGFTSIGFEGVHIFRQSEESWFFVSLWTHRDDLWEAECEAQF
jgi:hypothetical protein